MEEKIIKALYYIRKNQILQIYRTEDAKISDSFAYAISNDCYPYFHSDAETEIYKDCFSIKYDFIEKVLKLIDKAWIQKEDYVKYSSQFRF